MRQTIKKESIRLFGENGFKETSIQDIVQALHVTKGTFYYYFSSKEELLTEIHFEFIDNLVEQIDEIASHTTKKNHQKLVDVVRLMVINIKSERSSGNILFREMRHLGENSYTEIARKRYEVRERVEGIIEEGIRDGEFRANLNSSIVSLGILGIVNWSYQWLNPEGKFSPEEVANIFVDMILHGVLLQEEDNR
ncbi:AcrR family transcriptional regulator [Geomicrobium halophilum]|uniref:AcrR family transcriptional regulator n=1 Tax=Geomicrobium halophilum TaxID=549000 RepID=A0A841PZU9_9BACL|nr:TetR/AcrR family transcriptional regulator [Geomicrobium halophilum]MBB6450155.1 AcrR family transcriptional regulator [Geomicrobium halophilum]